MSAQHTPGPWTWYRDPEWDPENEYNSLDGPGKKQVIDYAGCGTHRIAVSEANARLIAAAPDMHALLIEALESLERAEFKHVEDATVALDLRQRIAALARAGVTL